MANRNWEDPYDVAELARENGPEGLMRLADYFETTGQPIPVPVKTALLTSRGPGVLPIQGIFPSKKPAVRSPVEGVPEALRPSVPFLEGAVETNRRAFAFNPTEAENEENAKLFGTTPDEMRKSFTQARANTFQPTELEIQKNAELFGVTPEEMRKSFAVARGNLGKSVSPASQAVRTVTSVQEPKGPRSVAEVSPSSSSTFTFAPPSYTLEDVAQGPTPEAIAKIAKRNVSLTSPIPVANAPSTSDAVAPVTSAIAATGPQTPAGPADSAGTRNLPPPSSEGAGGDETLSRLSIGQALTRALEGSGSIIAGRDLRSGAADTLGERMKQIEALRAKREERGLELTQERAQNDQLLDAYKGMFPEKAAELESLRGATGKPMFRDLLNAWQKKVEFEKAKLPTAEARVAQMGAGTELAKAKTPEVAFEGESKRQAREQAAALGWARLNQASKQASAKLTEGKPEAFRKEVNEKTQALGTSISKEYGEIGAALQEADRALLGVKGVSPDLFTKVAQAARLDTLNTPEERALFRSIGELRRAAQKAQSGLAVTEPERQEFLQTFGQNWTQSPSTLLEAIEWMRRKTRDKLNTSFATYRAQGDIGNTAIQAYEQAGGVTPSAEYLKPFSARAPKVAAAPAPAPSAAVQSVGMVKVRHAATGKTATVDRAKADEMLKRPGFEEVK